uniref:Uncharacterized protein n=1 Tax=Cannabis sativa TaxID=3483 RepID=A0A803P437_CANSA
MVERSCSLVNKLAYQLELLKSKRSNAEQRKEEATKALVNANAKMESIIKQWVNNSLDKVLAREKKVTKAKNDHGDRYKEQYTKALSQISNLEANLKQSELDFKESERKFTPLSKEYDKKSQIVDDKIVEATLEIKTTLHSNL